LEFTRNYATELEFATHTPSSGEAQPAIESADDAGIVMVDGIKKKRIEGFGGIIAEHNDESEE